MAANGAYEPDIHTEDRPVGDGGGGGGGGDANEIWNDDALIQAYESAVAGFKSADSAGPASSSHGRRCVPPPALGVAPSRPKPSPPPPYFCGSLMCETPCGGALQAASAALARARGAAGQRQRAG